MAKINTPEELRLMREKLRADLEIRENSNTPDELPQIRVSMDECGIAAGAKAVLATFVEELAARRIRGIVPRPAAPDTARTNPPSKSRCRAAGRFFTAMSLPSASRSSSSGKSSGAKRPKA